ncbi:hypothetical protein OPQ81_000649 [Rhizoctonia solani]|nr:hypothetical protein OPQ81_000649 [Rhizoctonia solani]
MNANITPILYGRVELPTSTSVELFCRTTAWFAERLGPYIHTLLIGGYQNYRQWHRIELSPSLRGKLSLSLAHMPNLRELMVAMMEVDLSACFDPLISKPPFSLEKLVIPLMRTSSFYKLLKSQPSIKELQIGSEHTLGEFEFSRCLSQQPELLPNLISIAAPISVLKGAVPGRPISHIAIITELLDWTDPGITIINPSTWQPILCGSRVAITSIGFYQSPHSADPWDQLVPALKEFSVHKTLKRLDIVEALDPPVTEWGKQESLSQRVKQIKILTEFDKLDSLELGEMSCIPSPAADVMLWLGNMNKITAWKAHMPSLKWVKIYGVNIS